MPSPLEAIVRIIKEIAPNPKGALQQLDRLRHEAPHALTQWQPQVLARALSKSSLSPEAAEPLALIPPKSFLDMAAPLPSDPTDKIAQLTRFRQGLLPDNNAESLSDSMGLSYLDHSGAGDVGQGYNDTQAMWLDDPYPGVAQTTDHSGRHRTMTEESLGYPDQLTVLNPLDEFGPSETATRRAELNEYLQSPDLDVHQEGTGRRVGKSGNLWRLLSALGMLPVANEFTESDDGRSF